jgi:hypothetical protein
LPGSRVRPFCLKKYFAYNRNKAKLDPFLMCSLVHYKISLLLFRFFSLIFASNFSLHFDLVIFTSKFSLHIRKNH